MNRTTFLIDGFNLYHSVKQASQDNARSHTKWLDIKSLCQSYVHIVGNKTGIRASLAEIYYFSAIVHHLVTPTNPDIVSRQQAYIRCLEDSGIRVELGRFKRKLIKCQVCGAVNQHHEEKETDVAIGARLIELFVNDKCDTVVIVTGDTDIASAVRVAKALAPAKFILFGFPYARKNTELAKLASSFTMSDQSYMKHQLPNPVILKNNKTINKPSKW